MTTGHAVRFLRDSKARFQSVKKENSTLKAEIQTLLRLQIRPGDNPPELIKKVRKITIRHT